MAASLAMPFGIKKLDLQLSFRRVFQLILISIALTMYNIVFEVILLHRLGDDMAVACGQLRNTDRSYAGALPGSLPRGLLFTEPEGTTVVVGYVVTIIGCDPTFPIAEAAAVLQHSIVRAAATSSSSGRYGYQFYAIYHPDAASCAKSLEPLGFTLLERSTPVPVDEIQGWLSTYVQTDGCCGEKDFIKFEAYTLTQHQIVVLLDLDALLLKPLDEVFDLILYRKLPDSPQQKRKLLMWPDRELPQDIQLLHTIDYAMSIPTAPIKPFQNGFAVLRPDQSVYEEFVSIIRQGNYNGENGWGGRTGHFWGSATVQGLMPYFYHVLYPGNSVELNWCTYNNMCSPSRNGEAGADIPTGTCYTNEQACEDCRTRKVDEIVSFHFTNCQKPWMCLPHDWDTLEHRLCRKVHHEWFKTRSEVEISWGRTGRGDGAFFRDQFFGYCSNWGKDGYIFMNLDRH